MRSEPAEEIFQIIASLASAYPDGYVAFDADGTLWSGDIGDDLFHAIVEGDAIRDEGKEAIEREARAAGVRVGPTVSDTARAIEAAYLAGGYPEERFLELTAWALAGSTAREVDAFCRDVLARAKLSERVQPETIAVMDRLRGAGVEIMVVSASPRALVELSVASFGVEASHVVATTPIFEDGVMLPEVVRPIPYGPGKVFALRALESRRALLAGFGDNHFDAPMLREAEIAVAVRPKPKLRMVANEVPGLIELAAS